MLDYIKAQTNCKKTIEHFDNHNLLLWVSELDKLALFDYEVITTKKVKQYKGICFVFYPKRLDILFKPHYFFNNNIHNGNDFYAKDCIKTILEFRETFKIDLSLLKIVNIEFGVNIIPNIDVKDLITYISYHEKNEFKSDVGLAFSKRSYRPKKNGTANRYKIVKAYAKGIHQHLYCDINTFRFEINSKESKYFKTLGIYTFNDLLNIDVYNEIAKKIILEFDDVLILDNITDFRVLNLKEQERIKYYNNPFNWYKIANNPYRNSFCNNREKYNNLINKIENNLKNQIKKLIIDKLKELKKGAISTTKKDLKYVQFPQNISIEFAPININQYLN